MTLLCMTGKLILEDGSVFEGISFGAKRSEAGEIVFSTGMVGYPESLTDPSYKGQILVATYPLIGNYGVPEKKFWESEKIQVTGLVVSFYNSTPSHFLSKRSLGEWLRDEHIPALQIADTRLITQILRNKGTMLGKVVFEHDIQLYDPNLENLVAKVSTKKVFTTKGNPSGRWEGKTFLLFDCGAKENITRCLAKRGVEVITVPWNYDPFDLVGLTHGTYEVGAYDGVVISNGPGDPKMAKETIEIIKKALKKRIPILGICLGHQLLALAAGGDTQKLKFGHRSQNQPCILQGSNRCYITTQNHGFHVAKIPKGFTHWFTNANDGSNEGIIHRSEPIMSVQFHPEACPGPADTEWIFDYFLERISRKT